MAQKLALIGFGEAGEAFASAAGWAGDAVVWDLLEARRAVAADAGLRATAAAAECLAGAPLVLSLVTADQALAAARDYAPLLAAGALWCD
ncbi:MAG TPA: NAD(P)-binding domain-containing protein, partial [Novosphingobium sp.]